MAYIFMDESGCLGFDFSKRNTSKYFIISFLCVENKNPLEKIVRRAFRSMHERERKRHRGALHCNKEHPRLRMRVLNDLQEQQGITLMLIRLNKRKVYTNLHNEKTVLYNYVANILLDRIISKKLVPTDSKIHLIASRRETNRFLNENFKGYLKRQSRNNHRLDMDVTICTPAEEKGLQLVDFVSWSAFRKYEHGDESYFEAIRRLVIEDKSLF